VDLYSMKMFNYNWELKDLDTVDKKNIKVFSCFSCGGGSSMGYKMTGFNVIGINEIDKQMVEVYNKNFKPKYVFEERIQDFKKRKDIPKELFNLDILDGSPPCSTFSISGKREQGWGKNKKFREGQATQVLSDLFFDYIELTKKLQPKVVIAENVKGMLFKNAKGYTKQILREFDEAGYRVQLFLLNAASMGVPQKRERIFFIGIRKDIEKPKIKLQFDEKPILFRDIVQKGINDRKLSFKTMELWKNKKYKDKDLGEAYKRLSNRTGFFNCRLLRENKVCNTITAADQLVLEKEPRHLNVKELILAGSFPQDYNFLKIKPQYLIGMSVPPIMINRIAEQVYKQWLI